MKKFLKQYRQLRKEIKDIKYRIKTFEQLDKDFERDNRYIIHINKNKDLLRARYKSITSMLNEIEEFINSIPDSEMRQIFTYYYKDNLTWEEIAPKLARVYIPDSIRRKHDNYLFDLIQEKNELTLDNQ